MFYVSIVGSLINSHTLKHAKICSCFVFHHIFLVSPSPMECGGKDNQSAYPGLFQYTLVSRCQHLGFWLVACHYHVTNYACGNQHGDIWSWGAPLLGVQVLCWASRSSVLWDAPDLIHPLSCNAIYCHGTLTLLSSLEIKLLDLAGLHSSTSSLCISMIPLEPPWLSPGHVGYTEIHHIANYQAPLSANAVPSHWNHIDMVPREMWGLPSLLSASFRLRVGK